VVLAFLGSASSASAQGIQELRVRWDTLGAPAAPTDGAAAAPSPSAFTLLGRQRAHGPLPRQRNPELSPDHVVVVAEDAHGRTLDWQVVTDPRLLRAEFPGPTGQLSGQRLRQPSAEFMITLPDDPDLAVLRLYHPRWTGRGFVLDPLGSVPLPP
jgi:hypothetical protein